MKGKQGLGKGFEGLIPTGFDVSSVVSPGESVRQIELSRLHPNPDQPRKSFDEAALKELASSIGQHGIIQPLVATPSDSGFRIIAGERRFRAAQIQGLKKVPVLVRDHKELEELEIALVENVQRVDLSPLETAVSIVRLRDQFSLTPKQIAKKLGKAETTISNTIRLLQLPKEAVSALQNGSISEGHARAILSLKSNEEEQKKLLNKIITQNISVREAEDTAKQHKQNTKQEITIDSSIKTKLKNIDKKQGTKTKIKPAKAGGNLTISFANSKQLDKLLNLLS